MNAGDTFIPKKFDNHLWIVLSDPSQNSEKIVITNFTSNTPNEEQHCIVKVGEHSFIKWDTAVRFRDSKVVSDASLQSLIRSLLLKRTDPLSPALLKRVREGADASDFLPEECREILEDQGLIG